jgi:glyoxylase-like metal-dependent hydrolase (beta-lactamase superfamily II)
VTGGPSIGRRTFLADLGRGAFAIAVLGVAGCAPSAASPSAGSPSAASSSPPTSPALAGTDSPPPGSADGAIAWTRVNLGFVSAYLLARGDEVAIVDTGVAGSAGDIEASLRSVGLDWANVGHVILTHRHPDHVGSVADVLDAAPDANGYAGRDDIGAISASRELQPLGDGDRVFDLEIVATPGHTPGHIAVLEPVGGILVAGDALNTQDGTLGGSPPQFTADMAAARASVAKLAKLRFETLLVGHGEPIEGGASAAVADLAAAGGGG